MDAFDAYVQYCALKNHFYTKYYDYFKYNGKVRASRQKFDTRSDKYFFHKLSKQKNVLDYLVANFVYSGSKWVGDLVNDDESIKRYRNLLKVRESLAYIFKEDIDKLNDDFNSNFTVVDGQHPPLLKKYLRGEINIETLIILNDAVRYFKHWNTHIQDPVVWPELYLKCKKYRPFMEFDKQKMKEILLDKWSKM